MLTPPHNLDAEIALLSAWLADPDYAAAHTAGTVGPSDFYGTANGQVFEVILDIHNSGKRLDIVTLIDEVQARPATPSSVVDVVESLAELPPIAAGCWQYAEIIKSHAVRRSLIATSRRTIINAQNLATPAEDALAGVLSEIDAITNKTDGGKAKLAVDVADTVKAEQERRHSEYLDGRIPGLPSGFPDLDRMTHGFKAGELITLAARPGHGKSVFALTVGTTVAMTAKMRPRPTGKTGGALLVSLEMSSASLLTRAVCQLRGLSMGDVMSGRLSGADIDRAMQETGLLDCPLFFHDGSGQRISSIVSHAKTLHKRHGIEMLIVDYLQLVKPDSREQTRDLEIGKVTGALKQLAMQLQIPVVMVAQLNRQIENRAKPRPAMSDLRESGNIEQDCDIILFITRDEHKDDRPMGRTVEKATMYLAKSRNGEVADIKLAFRGPNVRFEAWSDAIEAEISNDRLKAEARGIDRKVQH
jgi:replicative DNA helicase